MVVKKLSVLSCARAAVYCATLAWGARILMFSPWLLYNVVSAWVRQKYTVSNPVNLMKVNRVRWVNTIEAPIEASSFQLLKLENLLRWSFFTLIYNRSWNIWIISYVLYIKLQIVCNKFVRYIILPKYKLM